MFTMNETNWCGHRIYTKAVYHDGPYPAAEIYANSQDADNPTVEPLEECPECGAEIEVAW